VTWVLLGGWGGALLLVMKHALKAHGSNAISSICAAWVQSKYGCTQAQDMHSCTAADADWGWVVGLQPRV
jgi:hypothetical protein